MRWDDFRQSENVEDRRGMGMRGAGGLGIGTVVILGLVGWALGIDPRILIGGAEVLTRGQQEQAQPGERGVPSDESGKFVAAVLGDTEDRWKAIFARSTWTPRSSATWRRGSAAARARRAGSPRPT